VCGNEGKCPLFKLSAMPVNFVLLPKQTTLLLKDRNKHGISAAAVQFIHSANSAVIATDVSDSDEIAQLSRLDCEGIVKRDESPFTAL